MSPKNQSLLNLFSKMTKIKVGLPRALLYHKYHVMWESFFENLKGIEVVVSPETNKEIISRGTSLTVDETCLSVKLFMGHVDWLVGKVDYIFIPRIISVCRGEDLCTKFMGLTESVRNIFPDVKVLSYTIDTTHFRYEFLGMMRVALRLKQSPAVAIRAYFTAKNKFILSKKSKLAHQESKIENRVKTKPVVLIVSHPYTTYDSFFGEHISKILEEQGIDRKSTRLNSSHLKLSRMPSSA